MLGAIIGAGASLLGGILGNKSQSENMDKQIDMQKDFAQQGISWKVADAKRAGIHPLYALGAQTTPFQPMSVGNPLGEGIAAAGQDLGRAVDSAADSKSSGSAFVKTAQLLQLKRMALENDLLSSQIATTRQAGNPPPLNAARGGNGPIPGQNSALMPSPVPNTVAKDQGQVQVVPFQPETTTAGGTQEPGPISGVGYVKTPTGYFPVMSNAAKQRLEEDTPGVLMWNYNNRLLPAVGQNLQPPSGIKTNKGEVFVFDPTKMEYQLTDSRTPWRKYITKKRVPYEINIPY